MDKVIDSNSNQNLSNSLILVMAIASGVTVANLYYMQPLLADIGKTFNVDQAIIGFAAMTAQIGYATGIIFILPLGDIKEKRKLIIVMLLLSTCSLLNMFFSFSIFMLIISSLAVGFTSIIPQLIMPLAVQLSNPNQRGEIIGKILSGLLIGILLSRTFSGLLGEAYGWRNVYLIAAMMMVVLVAFLRKLLPSCEPVCKTSYPQLLKSMLALIKSEPVLREASLNGAMMFAAFNTFWTALIFLLKSSHFNMGAKEAGLFGIVGISGALAAPLVGKIADRKSPKFAITICLVSVTISYIDFFLFGFTIWGLILGLILLDLGVQSSNVCNQARVQALSEDARNRLQSIYMACFFLGGASGSFLGPYCYANFGWYGVCGIGITTQIIAAIVHKSKMNETKMV